MSISCAALGRLGALAALALLAAPEHAAAHHAMGGSAPSTWFEGLVSGLAHPVIGPDHLAFVLAAGVAAAYLGAGWRIPVTFTACSIIGVLGRSAASELALTEVAVAGTVVVAGLAIAAGRLRSPAAWIGFAALAGGLHGYAFGEAIIGSEATPVLWYLTGLAASQLSIALTVMATVGMTLTNDVAHSWRTRAAGLAIAAVGSAILTANAMAG